MDSLDGDVVQRGVGLEEGGELGEPGLEVEFVVGVGAVVRGGVDVGEVEDAEVLHARGGAYDAGILGAGYGWEEGHGEESVGSEVDLDILTQYCFSTCRFWGVYIYLVHHFKSIGGQGEFTTCRSTHTCIVAQDVKRAAGGQPAVCERFEGG